MLDGVPKLHFHALRKLERGRTVSQLYRLLKLFISARAWMNTVFKPPHPSFDAPREIAFTWTRPLTHRRRTDGYLNQKVRFFQDRLAEPKWRERCRFEGLDELRSAVESKCPVILAFCHFGPYPLLRSWLRAAGIPAAILIGAESGKRTPQQQQLDHLLAQPGIPTVIYLDQLRDATGFAKAGIPLLVALDGPAGKQMEVPFCEGWNIRMGTGAIRMAARYQASLFACSIVDEGEWRFRVTISGPMPNELLAESPDHVPAGVWLLNQLKAQFVARPDQCGPDLLRCLRRVPYQKT